MRVQHNIMAMNAYRNYNNNTKALSGNLEKLSSGYKINRAGDDAAGLAISEKMRAQITGLDAAQKNVKDGVSFVKTAEGAMQEIQDMLKRMKYLATESANGTYQNEVDRENLQKEVISLRTEIDRIAQSANFNGIYMLNGAAASTANANAAYTPAVANDGIALAALTKDTTVKASVAASVSGSAATTLGNIKMTASTTLASAAGSLAGKTLKLTFTATTGKAVEITVSFASAAASSGDVKVKASMTGAQLLEAIKGAVEGKNTTIMAGTDATKLALDKLTLTAGATKGFTAKADVISLKVDTSDPSTKVPANTTVSIDLSKIEKNFKASDTIKIGDVTYKFVAAASSTAAVATPTTVTVALGSTVEKSLANLAKAIDDQKATTKIGAEIKDGKLVLTTTGDFDSKADFEAAVTINLDGITDPDTKAALKEAWDAGVKEALDKLGNKGGSGKGAYEITLQIGDDASSYNRMNLKISGMRTDDIMGHAFKVTPNEDGTFDYTIDAAKDVNNMSIKQIDIGDPDGAAKAIEVIKNAINYVSSVRGDLGATQNRLDHTLNNLSVMAENIQDAESTIRDTDVANEMMSYVKNNILVQSAQAMLAQANQVPQGVLQLLG